MSTHQHQLLCLSCSSSPPPKGGALPFMTTCCSRPICADCLARTPRLRDYNPCLACLAGVSVVKRPAAKTKDGVIRTTPLTEMHKRETEMFALGADSDDSDDDGDRQPLQSLPGVHANPDGSTFAPETPSNVPVLDRQTMNTEADACATNKHTTDRHATRPTTATYYIQRGDTIQGLSLKFGVVGIELCKLNGLPLSTLSTTPHLLHTRRSIDLPPNARNLDALPPAPTAEQEAGYRRERAEKRFQFVTKEQDWRVARAYMALAEDEAEAGDPEMALSKEGMERKRPQAKLTPEHRAVGNYLDDTDWESSLNSPTPAIPRFPLKA